MCDVALIAFPEKRKVIDAVRKDPRRKIIRCGKQHKDFGNTCRYNAYEYCSGDYVLFLDDDDCYADNKVLETLTEVTKPWATFPTLKQGVYYQSEPGLNRTGSGMIVHRREIGRYPCESHLEGYEEIIARLKPQFPNMGMHQFLYASDGLLSEYLKERYPYQVLTGRALTVYERANKGA